MAAGLGTRLRPFTDQVGAKATLPLMGIPIAQYAIDALAAAGVSRVVANVHHRARETVQCLQSLDHHGMELLISDESGELLGSAGGIRKALPLLGSGPFFLLNADVVSDISLRALALFHERMRDSQNAVITFALNPGVSTQDKYREFESDAKTGRVTKLGDFAVGKPFWTGAAVLETSALEEVPAQGAAEFIPTILEPAIRKKAALGVLTPGAWYDIGSPRLWFEAHLALIRGLETGQISEQWRMRIEKINRRMAQEIWVNKEASRCLRVIDWMGPSYWNNLKNPKMKPPRVLGPAAVLYGEASADRTLTAGVGHSGIWVDLS